MFWNLMIVSFIFLESVPMVNLKLSHLPSRSISVDSYHTIDKGETNSDCLDNHIVERDILKKSSASPPPSIFRSISASQGSSLDLSPRLDQVKTE